MTWLKDSNTHLNKSEQENSKSDKSALLAEPEQYILEGWDDICATANTSLDSDCPLLDDEVLVEMHKYVAHLNQRNNELEILLEDLKADLLLRADIDSKG